MPKADCQRLHAYQLTLLCGGRGHTSGRRPQDRQSMYNNHCNLPVCAAQGCLAGFGRTGFGLRRARPHPSMVPSEFIPAGDKPKVIRYMQTVQGQRTVAGCTVPRSEHSVPELLAAKASPDPAVECMSRPDSRCPGSTWPPGLQRLHRDTISGTAGEALRLESGSPVPCTLLRGQQRLQGKGRVSVIVQCPTEAVMQTSSDRAGLPAVNQALVTDDTVAAVINHREAKDLQIG